MTSAGRPTIVLDKVTKFSEQVEVVVEDASKLKLNSKRVQMTQAIRKLKKKNDVRDASQQQHQRMRMLRRRLSNYEEEIGQKN